MGRGQGRWTGQFFLAFWLLLVLLPGWGMALEPAGSPLPVFPGAEGFGTDTPAGRGGALLRVTNLNDSGDGSLRAALEAPGARIVVFEISGNIDLKTPIYVYNPYLTIAGQTAPSPGITVRHFGLVIRTHDVLLQHLRLRPGDLHADELDAMTLMWYPERQKIRNVVIDHCSLSWGMDEVLDINYDVDNITVSHSIISEGLQLQAYSKGILISSYCDNIALVKNLIAHHDERFPEVNQASSALQVNNLAYNAGRKWVSLVDGIYNPGPVLFASINNHFIDGPSTSAAQVYWLHDSLKEGSRVFIEGTLYEGKGQLVTNLAAPDMLVDTPPLWHASLRLLPTVAVYPYVLVNAGARPADRDAVDERIVREVQSRQGRLIARPSEVGGAPPLAVYYRPFIAPNDPHGDEDGDGYTNVEEVLHELARQVETGQERLPSWSW